MRARVGLGLALGSVMCVWLPSLTRVAAHTRITTTVTWEREIAPIVQARCLTCHTEGGRTPMSLATYEAARPWARAIRHEVLTRRMPKWHAARGYGEFANDPSLSPFEIQLIVAWVDGGAPKTLPASGPPPGPRRTGSSHADRRQAGREVVVPCGMRTLPTGELQGLQPRLDRGGSVRVTALLPDGRREILGWFRDFDPAFTPVYWLQTPLALPAGSRLVTEIGASGSCSLALQILSQVRIRP
jgi:hypothetical protein